MRFAILAAALIFTAALAGCSNKKDTHDDTYVCASGPTLDLTKFSEHHNSTFKPATKCTSSSTTTSQAPNKLPTMLLTVTDDLGNATRVTLLDGNLTFDATGSADPDGKLTGIAVTVKDSNTTRTATLFDAKTNKFTPATFKFDRPGVVNVTVAAVDDRAGFAVNNSHVYVNHFQSITSQSFTLTSTPLQILGVSTDCNGPVEGRGQGSNVFDPLLSKEYTFATAPEATFVEATIIPSPPLDLPLGDGVFIDAAICDPTGVAISGVAADNMVRSNAGTPFVESLAYYVFIVNDGLPLSEAGVNVLVHYEPDTAAPAA